MQRPHDRGGWPNVGPIDTAEHELAQWEKNTHALMGLLRNEGLIEGSTRPALESIPPEDYESMSYYERWITAMEDLLKESNVLTSSEIDDKVLELEKED